MHRHHGQREACYKQRLPVLESFLSPNPKQQQAV
jgi:hypothetical protein